MKLNRLIIIGALLLGTLSVYAVNVEHLNATFESGGTFSGDLTFTPSWDNLVAVDGYLVGSTYGNDHITWIWDPTRNFASDFGGNLGGNYLMDGAPPMEADTYSHFFTITWDYSIAPTLSLVSPGGTLSIQGGNNINYADPLVSYSFSNVNSVPEGDTYATGLCILSMLGFAFLVRRKAVKVAA